MLQRTISYSSLLRVLGGCFLLYGLYVIVLALTCQIEVTGAVQYSGATIFVDPMGVENFLFSGGFFPGNPIVPVPISSLVPFGLLTPGPLMWVELGILCVCLTTKLSIRRVPVSFVGFQLALWMISASVWNPLFWLLDSSHSHYGLGDAGPFFLVTLALSLILLAIYKPVAHGLRTLGLPPA